MECLNTPNLAHVMTELHFENDRFKVKDCHSWPSTSKEGEILDDCNLPNCFETPSYESVTKERTSDTKEDALFFTRRLPFYWTIKLFNLIHINIGYVYILATPTFPTQCDTISCISKLFGLVDTIPTNLCQRKKKKGNRHRHWHRHCYQYVFEACGFTLLKSSLNTW